MIQLRERSGLDPQDTGQHGGCDRPHRYQPPPGALCHPSQCGDGGYRE